MDELNMEEMNPDEMDNIIVLNDEQGNEVSFEYLDLIEHEGVEYVVLLPISDEEAEEDEVVILKVEPIEGTEEESYVSVDDQELLLTIFEIFKEHFADEFDFAD